MSANQGKAITKPNPEFDMFHWRSSDSHTNSMFANNLIAWWFNLISIFNTIHCSRLTEILPWLFTALDLLIKAYHQNLWCLWKMMTFHHLISLQPLWTCLARSTFSIDPTGITMSWKASRAKVLDQLPNQVKYQLQIMVKTHNILAAWERIELPPQSSFWYHESLVSYQIHWLLVDFARLFSLSPHFFCHTFETVGSSTTS